MFNKAKIVFLTFFSSFSCSVSFADNLFVGTDHVLSDVPTNTVWMMNYLSNASAFASGDSLNITVDPTAKICLYTDVSCTQHPVCSYGGVSYHSVLDLNNASASYAFRLAALALDNLAKQGSGSATSYNCLSISLDYTTTHSTALAQDTPTTYTCRVVSTGSGSSATFTGGNTSDGNPCGVPNTQFIFPASFSRLK